MAQQTLKNIFFLGKWQGTGQVIGTGVTYNEEFNSSLIRGKPAHVIMWQQTTQHAQNGNPLHAEAGLVKILPAHPEGEGNENNYKVEASFCHPFSLNEFEFGVFTDAEPENAKT